VIAREMNRLRKVMQDVGIKLDCVATDMMGKSGRAVLDALVVGTTDRFVLADLARELLRKKIPALGAALEGRFDSEHSLVGGRILAHIDYLDETIDNLSAAIEEQLGPSRRRVSFVHDARCRSPRRRSDHRRYRRRHDGVPVSRASRLLGRHGPGNGEPAGKRRSAKTRKGSKWLSQTLVECVLEEQSSGSTEQTHPAAGCRRSTWT
jgi:transposase